MAALNMCYCVVLWVCFIGLWCVVDADRGNESRPCDNNLDLPLLLTPLLEANRTEEARRQSVVDKSFLEEFAPPSHAGYFTVDKELGNHMFFWFFPSPTKASHAPLILWLNGGPTVSSMLGLFHENGPLALGETRKRGIPSYYPRKHSWVGPFSVLYVDNPVNVGFSYSESGADGDTFTEEQVTKNLYSVLEQFFRVFPDYRDVEFYIGGQSYAGMYVISLAHHIHARMGQGHRDVVISGIYLGGPFFDPETQLPLFAEYHYHLGGITHKTLEDYKKVVKDLYQNREAVLNTEEPFENLYHVLFPWVAYNNFITQEMPPYVQLGVLMNSPDIKRALHAGKDRTFLEHNPAFRGKFANDSLESRVGKLAVVLNHYKALIYNGDLDTLVTSASIEASLVRTPWSMQQVYNRTHFWMISSGSSSRHTSSPGTPYCLSYARVGRLCRVVVCGAGHMTPHDQPELTVRVMEDFARHGCVRVREKKEKNGKGKETLTDMNSWLHHNTGRLMKMMRRLMGSDVDYLEDHK